MKPHLKYQLFRFDPDTGGGSGGSTATIETPTSGDVHDVDTFEVAPASDIEGLIDGTAVPAVEKEPAAEKVIDKIGKKPEAKKADAVVPEKKGSVAELRNQYEATKKERDEHKAKVAELEAKFQDHPELKSTRTELEAARAKLAESEKRDAEYNRQLAMHNPAATKELRALDKTFSETVIPQLEYIPNMSHGKYKQLVTDFMTLPHGTPEFGEALADFRANIRAEFDEDALQVFELVKAGRKHSIDSSALAKTIQADASKYAYESASKEYEAFASEYDADAAKFFEIPEGILEKDPYNPLGYVKAFMDQAPEPVKELMDKFSKTIRQAALGLRPDRPEDFHGLTADQIAEKRAENVKNHRAAVKQMVHLANLAPRMMVAQRELIADYKRLEERLAKYEGGDPPDATKTDATKTASADGDEWSIGKVAEF